jgi:hypothetical protein
MNEASVGIEFEVLTPFIFSGIENCRGGPGHFVQELGSILFA